MNTLFLLFQNKKVLGATTRHELDRRYSGTLFGSFWIFAYPILFLSVYLFVYLVVFKTSWPGYSRLDYVLYVFSGLVPFIAFMESFQSGAQSVKQNLHLIKNVLLPIELIPARTAMVAVVSNLIGVGLIIALALFNQSISVNFLLLPLALLSLYMFLLGVVYIMAPLGIMLPDINHLTGIISLFLVFLSPIGFRPDMLEGQSVLLAYGNPLYYIMAPFRMAFDVHHTSYFDYKVLIMSFVVSVTTLLLGTMFFKKFKNVLVDYE